VEATKQEEEKRKKPKPEEQEGELNQQSTFPFLLYFIRSFLYSVVSGAFNFCKMGYHKIGEAPPYCK
jgi:hypothetical protein